MLREFHSKQREDCDARFLLHCGEYSFRHARLEGAAHAGGQIAGQWSKMLTKFGELRLLLIENEDVLASRVTRRTVVVATVLEPKAEFPIGDGFLEGIGLVAAETKVDQRDGE